MTSFFKEPKETHAAKQARKRAEAWARKKRPAGGKALEKIAKKPREDAHRAEIRKQVWARSGGKCEYCGDTEYETAQKCHKRQHEMHEEVMRSKTRGLPPEQRFNLEICKRACLICHRKQHRLT